MLRVFVFDWSEKLPYKVSHGKAIQVTYSPDEVFSRIQHEDIQFIDLQFTGLTGHFHHTTISSTSLRNLMTILFVL